MTGFADGVKAAVSKAWQRVSKPVAGAVLTSSMIAATMVVAPGVAHATGDDYREGSQTFGSGTVLGVGSTAGDRSWNDLVGVGGTQEIYRTESDDPNTQIKGNRELLQITDAAGLPLGDGFELPLIKTETNGGLLDLGTMGVGVAGSISWTDNPHHSFAASGLVNDNGAIALTINQDGKYATADGNEYKPVRISVTDLLRQVIPADVVWDEALLKDVSVELGVGGSSAELSVVDGVQKLHSNYVVAGAKVVVDAPILKNIVTLLNAILFGDPSQNIPGLTGYLRNGLLSLGTSGGGLSGIADIRVNIPDGALEELLQKDISNDAYTAKNGTYIPAGLVALNLSTGKITIDLEKLHSGKGAGADQGLNGLPPNTDLLRAEDVNLILETVGRLLGTDGQADTDSHTLLSKLTNILDEVVHKAKIEVEVLGLISSLKKLPGFNLLFGTLELLNPGFLDSAVTISVDLSKETNNVSAKLLGIDLLTLIGINKILDPIVQGLLGLVADLPAKYLSPLLNRFVVPLLEQLVSLLDPVLDGLSRVINVKVNRQMVKAGSSAKYEYDTLHNMSSPMSRAASTGAAYNGESFSVAAAEIGLVNWSKDKSKSSAITVTLAESDVRVLPLTQAGELSCGTIDGETCYTLEAPGLFDPANGTTLSSITYRGVVVPEENIKVKESTGETTADGIAIQRIKFVPPAEPDGGWPADEDGNPSNKIIVTRNTPAGTSDPYMTTWFGTLEFDIPARKLGTLVTYTDAVVAPGTNNSPEVTLTAATPAEGDTFYGLDTDKVKELLDWALDSNLGETQKLTDLRELIKAADKAAAAAAAPASATPTSTEAPTPDTTGTDTGSGTEATTSAPTEAEFATAIAGMPEFWTVTTPSLDLASTKARAAVALIDAILAKSKNIIVPDGSTKLEALKAQISAGTSVNSTNGTVTASVPTGQTGVIVPVMQMSTDCTISFAAAHLIKAPDYMGTLPDTGGSGVGLYGIVASLIAALTTLATWWLARRRPA